MENFGPGRVFFKKRDLLFLAGLLVLAGLLFVLFWPRLRPLAPVAEVTVGTGTAQTRLLFPLDENRQIPVEGGQFPVWLQVENRGISFVNAQCPDRLCEGFGVLRHEGDWASCLPAQVFVRVTEG